MASVKTDVMWSPNHEDKFLTVGTDLTLYKVEALKGNVPPNGMKISDSAWATPLSVNSSPENQYMKCLAWYPHKEPSHLLAVGLANGKVLLQSFVKGSAGSDPHRLTGKEFVPKHARPCNYLAWNPVQPNLLAEGLDKYKADHSILIWDVFSQSSIEMPFPGDTRKFNHTSNDMMAYKPYVELGHSETSLSFAWFLNEPRTFVTGMNNKLLRIYDLRDITRPQSVAYTKAVYGLKVDPHFDHRLASFYEGQVLIWDTRNFDKPHVLTLSETKHVSKLSWSPSRSCLLGCLTKESPVINLFDIQSTPVGSDELEPAVIEKIVQPVHQQNVSSFDWHPKEENRMLTVTTSGIIKDVKIFERIAVDWSPDVHLTWGCGHQIKQSNSVKVCKEAAEDISIKMKRRALKGYGLQSEVLQNISLIGDDPKLRNLWLWIHHVKAINGLHKPLVPMAAANSSIVPSPLPAVNFYGVKQILKECEGLGEVSGRLTEIDSWMWQGIDGYKFRTRKNVFRSEERVKALELCGWGFDKDNPSLPIIERLESEGHYERAAAISIFTLKLRRAIQVLKTAAMLSHNKGEGGDINYNMVAMALSGFSDEKNTLWKEMCSSLSSQLSSPYLRAMFSFITCDTDSYTEILNETGLEISDKVALACMYLPDVKLNDFVDDLTRMLSSAGNLDGVLLTGLTVDGLDLFGQYVDMTGDVQSVCMAILQALPDQTLSKDPRVHMWIECYRDLLNTWRLWHQRAEFDVFRHQHDAISAQRAQPQVYVSCNFCGKSISYSSLSNRNRHFMYGSALTHKSKVSSCPGCRKPLPRCALCLINMGTSAGSGKPRPADLPDDEEQKLTKLSEWFTWCQTCRHGGHADHMMQWFKDQSECPVTGCSCKCTLLDSMCPMISQEIASVAL